MVDHINTKDGQKYFNDGWMGFGFMPLNQDYDENELWAEGNMKFLTPADSSQYPKVMWSKMIVNA